MDRDDFFKLAVHLVAPSLTPTELGGTDATGRAIVTHKILAAYSAIVDAHNHLPEVRTAGVKV